MNFFDDIKDYNYKYIVSDIIENSEFRKLDDIKHHGGSRLQHSLKVSYYSYLIAKALRLDYEATARAGVLHDFYFERTKEKKRAIDKVKLFSTGHPKDAVTNASFLFNLSDKEKDIIKAHMFPIDYRIPKYVESWIVSFVDKAVSFKEFGTKFNYQLSTTLNYQLSTTLNIWLLLLINLKK